MGWLPQTEADARRLDPEGFRNMKPLNAFGATLCRDKGVVTALKAEFGESAKLVIRKLKRGELQGDALGIIQELIHENETLVETLTGEGSYGEFPIEIYGYAGVYWVSAPEFADSGYFESVLDAQSCADLDY